MLVIYNYFLYFLLFLDLSIVLVYIYTFPFQLLIEHGLQVRFSPDLSLPLILFFSLGSKLLNKLFRPVIIDPCLLIFILDNVKVNELMQPFVYDEWLLYNFTTSFIELLAWSFKLEKLFETTALENEIWVGTREIINR